MPTASASDPAPDATAAASASVEPAAHPADAATLLATAVEEADQSAAAFEQEIDELLGQLPSKVAERERAEREDALAQEEARRTNEEIQRLAREARDRAAEEEFQRLSRYRDQQPLDETVLRPQPDGQELHDDLADDLDDPELIDAPDDQEEHFVVRRTRDYDHDAQSVNTVAEGHTSAFATITEPNSSRDVRRDPYAKSKRKDRVPGEGNSRSLLRPFIAILLIALVLGGGGAVLTYGMEMWGGKSVPSVEGLTQASAEERLQEKGFKTTVVAEPADDAIGKVLVQTPEAGERVPEGSEVKVTVATNRTIPEVLGLTEGEARQKLEQAGANRIKSETIASSEPEGTVVSVTPGVGEAFVSRGTVHITVATPFTVPDVIGQKETDAVDLIKGAGLGADVSYVISDQTVRTVVETIPGPGEVIEEGDTVSVKVSSPYPTSLRHLAEFFDHSSQDVDTYLQEKEEFSFGVGLIDATGNALATYTSEDRGNITFSSKPYETSFALPKEGSSNVMATGAPIAGVRLDLPAGSAGLPSSSASIDREAVDALIEDCAFDGMTDFVDNASMKAPAGTPATTATYACASGKMDNLVWTVLIMGSGNRVRASVTCGKEGLYHASDLAQFDGRLCAFEVYEEVLLDPAYQVVVKAEPEKKDDTKEGEKKDDSKDAADGSSQENAGEQGETASGDENAATQEGDQQEGDHDNGQ